MRVEQVLSLNLMVVCSATQPKDVIFSLIEKHEYTRAEVKPYILRLYNDLGPEDHD